MRHERESEDSKLRLGPVLFFLVSLIVLATAMILVVQVPDIHG